MKKLFFLLLLALTFNLQAADKKQYKYYDASKMTVVNKAQANGNPYTRLDVDKYPDVKDRVRIYLNHPTGMAIKFKTNSPVIKAKWETADTINRSNQTANATKGLDLYIKENGEWLFAGIGTPHYNGGVHSATLVSDLAPGMHECMIYLPLFMDLKKLEIGVEEGSKLEYEGGFERSPIVAMGSSFTHGAASSRTGMPWPAQLSRILGVNVANLGTSGLQKMEPFFAEIIADTDADMFIFDTFSNPSAEEIRARFKPFIKIIRAKHPNTPLVFLETFKRSNSNFDTKKRKFEADKKAAAEQVIAEAMATDPNIYYLAPGLYAGEDTDNTADGIHPSDWGYHNAAANIAPKIRGLMNKYGIK